MGFSPGRLLCWPTRGICSPTSAAIGLALFAAALAARPAGGRTHLRVSALGGPGGAGQWVAAGCRGDRDRLCGDRSAWGSTVDRWRVAFSRSACLALPVTSPRRSCSLAASVPTSTSRGCCGTPLADALGSLGVVIAGACRPCRWLLDRRPDRQPADLAADPDLFLAPDQGAVRRADGGGARWGRRRCRRRGDLLGGGGALCPRPARLDGDVGVRRPCRSRCGQLGVRSATWCAGGLSCYCTSASGSTTRRCRWRRRPRPTSCTSRTPRPRPDRKPGCRGNSLQVGTSRLG